MNNHNIEDFLKSQSIPFLKDVELKVFTRKNQEGRLPVVVYPETESQLIEIVKYCWENDLSSDVLGALTNTYLCDDYSRDAVISTVRLKTMVFQASEVRVSAGYGLTKMAKELSERGLDGYVGFIGIPGTVGAAAINNSGAFECSMSRVVKSVRILSKSGNIETITNKELDYKTRSSALKKKTDFVLLSVDLSCENIGDKDKIQEQIRRNAAFRKTNVDGARMSLGSVFVSSTVPEIRRRHALAMSVKRIVYGVLKLIIKKKTLNVYLDFLFLGHPSLARHCDSMNRFCWDKDTKEQDFFHYLDVMQQLAGGGLEVEIEIKK